MFFAFTLSSLASPAGAAALEPVSLHVLDVGYGDAFFLEWPNGTNLLIDAGGRDHASAVGEYLRAKGIERVDQAVITHPHDNHYGGFFDLLDRFSIGRVYTHDHRQGDDDYPDFLNALREHNIPRELLRRGGAVSGLPAGARIRILHPDEAADGSSNDLSLVLWFTYGRASVLFWGDVGPSVQQAVLDGFPDARGADIVVISHHGRDLMEGMADVFPERIFIVSTGPNKWGPPDEAALKRLSGRVLRTDRDGSTRLQSDGIRWTVME